MSGFSRTVAKSVAGRTLGRWTVRLTVFAKATAVRRSFMRRRKADTTCGVDGREKSMAFTQSSLFEDSVGPRHLDSRALATQLREFCWDGNATSVFAMSVSVDDRKLMYLSVAADTFISFRS